MADPREHRGHRIEVRGPTGDTGRGATADEADAGAGEVLLVDGQPVPHGRFPDGQYFLRDYAYDWSDDLAELATRWIDHRERDR